MAILSYNEITPKKVIIFNDEPYLVLSYHVFRKRENQLTSPNLKILSLGE